MRSNGLFASSALFKEINNSLPTLVPQLHMNLSDTTFKVLSSYVPIANVLSADDFTKMFAAEFGEQFALIPETVEYSGSENGSVLISAMLKANVVSRPYTEAAVKGMNLITANIFQDREENIWKVVGTGDDRRIVQTVKEDFKRIIDSRVAARRNELIANVAFRGMPVSECAPGDFSLFFNTQADKIDCGFIFKKGDGFGSFSYDSRSFVGVNPNAVVRGVDISEIKRTLEAFDETSMDNFDMTDGQFTPARRKQYQDYMSFLYNGTDYFAKLKNLLSLREKNGRDDLPTSTMR